MRFLAVCYFIGIARRAADRRLAGRPHHGRDPRESAARGGRRPQRPRLQAARLRHRRRLCRLRRRPARRAAGLYAARRFRLRYVGPVDHADGDRRPGHFVRAARRRGGVALSARFPAGRRSASARHGSSCSASSSFLLVCFLRRGIIGGLRDLSCALERRAKAAQTPRRGDQRAEPASARTSAPTSPSPRRPGRRPRRRLCRADPCRPRACPSATAACSPTTTSISSVAARRASRRHRPERRGQEHVLQNADLRGASRHPARSCSRGATSPASKSPKSASSA